jgi:hypothetical protein
MVRITEHPWTWLLDSDFPHREKVRDIGECTVWITAPMELRLVLVDPVHQQVAEFEYDSLLERQRDIRMLHRLRDDGGGPEAGVAAWLRPRPPRRTGTEALILPEPESDEEE